MWGQPPRLSAERSSALLILSPIHIQGFEFSSPSKRKCSGLEFTRQREKASRASLAPAAVGGCPLINPDSA